MGYILYFLIILNFSFFYSKRTNRNFLITIPTIFFGICLALYTSGILFSSFQPGIILINILSIPIFIWNIVEFFKRSKQEKGNYKNFLLVLIIYIIIIIIFKNFKFNVWDDFTHWALTVKNMITFNRLPNGPESTIFFKTYPPITGILQYSFNYYCNLFHNGNIESNSLIITSFFISTVLLSIISMKEIKKFNLKSILFVFLLLVLAILNKEVYRSLYVDSILGLMGAYIIIYFESTKYNLTSIKVRLFDLVLATMFLTLVKATGSAIVIFCLIYFIIGLFTSSDRKRDLVIIIFITLASQFIKKSWGHYLIKTNTQEIWHTSKITISSILNIFKGNGETYQYNTIVNFFKAILGNSIGFVPYIVYFLLIITVLFIKWKKDKSDITFKLLVFNSVIMVIYPISLLLMYVFIFSAGEAENLASFSRYLSTILIFLIIIDVYFVLCEERINKNKKLFVFILIVLALSNNTIKKLTYGRSKELKKVEELRNSVTLPSQIITKNSKIYFVSQDDSGMKFWVYRYLITPIKTQNGYYTKDEDILKELGDYDYLYLNNVDQSFENKYKNLFVGKIESNKYYKINKTNNSIKLETLN